MYEIICVERLSHTHLCLSVLSYVLYVVVLVLLQVPIQYVRNVISFPGLIFFSGPNYLCAFMTICLINLKLLKLVSLAISRLLAIGIIMK